MQDFSGNTPLHYACKTNHETENVERDTKVVRTLLEHISKIDSKGISQKNKRFQLPLHIAGLNALPFCLKDSILYTIKSEC